MKVSYSELGPREFRAAIGELVGVYAAAMNPPERLIGGREAIMDRHAASPGFRCLTAVDDGVVAGFCYGFHGESGQWWHDMVASALASRSGTRPQGRPRFWRFSDIISSAPPIVGGTVALSHYEERFMPIMVRAAGLVRTRRPLASTSTTPSTMPLRIAPM